VTEASPTLETTAFTCPRCNTEVTERFWGPCAACRQQLKATLGADKSATGGENTGDTFEAAKFEPAMHVTPNHVATKD